MTVERLIEILQDNNPKSEVFIETLIKQKRHKANDDYVVYNRGLLTGVSLEHSKDYTKVVLYSNDSINFK